MKNYYVAIFLLLIPGCDEAIPPCSPDEPMRVEVTVGAGPSGAATGDFKMGDDGYGYSRNADGEVCACDLEDSRNRACSKERPNESTDSETSCGGEFNPCGWVDPRYEADPTQYHKQDAGVSKPEPPPDDDEDDGPETPQWHCTGQAECWTNDNYFIIFASGYGDTEEEAQEIVTDNMLMKCRNLTKWLGKMKIDPKAWDCGKL